MTNTIRNADDGVEINSPPQKGRSRAVWCMVVQWPVPQFYGRCPYCGLVIEPKVHPDWPDGA